MLFICYFLAFIAVDYVGLLAICHVFYHSSVCSWCCYDLPMLLQRMQLFDDNEDDSADDELTVRHEFSGHEGSKVYFHFNIDLTAFLVISKFTFRLCFFTC